MARLGWIVAVVVAATATSRAAAAEPPRPRGIEAELGLGGSWMFGDDEYAGAPGGIGSVLGIYLPLRGPVALSVSLHTAEFGIGGEDAPALADLAGGLAWRIPLTTALWIEPRIEAGALLQGPELCSSARIAAGGWISNRVALAIVLGYTRVGGPGANRPFVDAIATARFQLAGAPWADATPPMSFGVGAGLALSDGRRPGPALSISYSPMRLVEVELSGARFPRFEGNYGEIEVALRLRVVHGGRFATWLGGGAYYFWRDYSYGQVGSDAVHHRTIGEGGGFADVIARYDLTERWAVSAGVAFHTPRAAPATVTLGVRVRL